MYVCVYVCGRVYVCGASIFLALYALDLVQVWIFVFSFSRMNMIWLTSSLLLQVAIDSATPVDEAGPSGNFMMNSVDSFGGGYGGPLRSYGRMYGSLDFDDVSIYTLLILWPIREMENWIKFDHLFSNLGVNNRWFFSCPYYKCSICCINFQLSIC